MLQPSKEGFGVIVGRFQEKDLSSAHQELIQYSVDRHNTTIVVLGETILKVTKHDPLNFEARRQMIIDRFPSVVVLSIEDHRSDAIWSKNLDRLIAKNTPPGASVTFYGSRDSFLDVYNGRYPNQRLSILGTVSSTLHRLADGQQIVDSKQFRHGVVWATQNQWPKVQMMVDVAPILGNTVVMIKKDEDGGMLRFVGGHVECTVNGNFAMEQNAIKEMKEETGLDTMLESTPIVCAKYLGSFVIDDWRYRSSGDSAMTAFFMIGAKGVPIAGDDADAVVEVDLKHVADGSLVVVPEHAPLLKRLREYIENEKLC